MSLKKYIFIIFLIFGVHIFLGEISGYAAPASGIIHMPIKSAVEGERILFEAKIEDPNIRIEYMRLFFRKKGQSNYRYLEMDEQLSSFTLDFPEEEVVQPGIEYFILGVLSNKTMISSPATNPYYAPYEIVVNPVSKNSQAGVVTTQKSFTSKSGAKIQTIILSPEPMDRVEKDEVIIAVSFLGEVDKLNLSKIKLFLDNQNVTSKSDITANMISYVPGEMSGGTHEIKLELYDDKNNKFEDLSWKFTVSTSTEISASPKIARSFRGTLFAETKSEKFSDSTMTTHNIGTNFRGKYGTINYNGMAFVTSREKSYYQPRNRFLIEVGTSWIGVKFGDTTPRFNELMLWGRRVRGIEAYIKLGFFNIEFVQGETNRGIEGIGYIKQFDPAQNDTIYIHPITGQQVTSSNGIYRYGTYKQTLLGIRPSFGGGENFQIGLNVLKVKDDSKSITYSTKPKDNVVIGPDFLLAFDNHRIELKASAAFSFLANDITNGSISQADLDSVVGEIPFDPAEYEDYFVLNTSLIPLDPSQLSSLAIQGSFKFNYFNNNLSIIYKSIGSEYYSLANSFLRKDISGFSVFDRIRIYQNQIYLNLGYEKYLEGISTEDDGEITTEPTDYNSLNIGFSYYPQNQFLPRVNINWKDYERDNGLDTTVTYSAVNYSNQDVSVQLGYDISLFDLNHSINLGYIGSDRVDGFHRIQSNVANNIQMLSLRTAYQIPLSTVVTYATNKNNAGEGLYDFKYNMFGLSADYKMMEGQLNLRCGLNITNAKGSNTYTTTTVDNLGNPVPITVTSTYTDYKRLAYNLGASYQFLQHHNLFLDMNFIDFNDKASQTFKDSLFRIRYELRY